MPPRRILPSGEIIRATQTSTKMLAATRKNQSNVEVSAGSSQLEQRARLLWQGEREEHEDDDRQARYHEHRVVDVEAERPDARLDVVLPDLVGGLD